LAFSALITPSIRAQVDAVATARYDEQGQMVTLFGIYGTDNAKESKCSLFTLTGNIVSVEHDSKGQITNFYIKPRRGKSQNVYLTGITVDKRLPADEIKRLPSLIARGKRVRLRYYGCGTTGAHNEADGIDALN
jgi:hypothetical protein